VPHFQSIWHLPVYRVTIKASLSLYLIKHYDMKTWPSGGIAPRNPKLHITAALASRKEGMVGTRGGLDAKENRGISYFCRESNCYFVGLESVALSVYRPTNQSKVIVCLTRVCVY
jgi:hypothetical protein